MECVKLGFGVLFFFFFLWMPMVAASDYQLSPKGVNYEGMCHVGLQETKPMFCFSFTFFPIFIEMNNLCVFG